MRQLCKINNIVIGCISIGICLYVITVKISLEVTEMQKCRHKVGTLVVFHKNHQFSHEHTPGILLTLESVPLR